MSGDASVVAQRLKNQPTLSELRKCLIELGECDLATPSPALADAFNILLIDVIPTFATETAEFVEVFSSCVGLACLCSRLRMPIGDTEQQTLQQLLETVLDQDDALITRLWRSNEGETRKLFWGSRVLAAAAPLRTSWAGNAAEYSRWLTLQMLKLDWLKDGELVDKTAKLGKPKDALAPYIESLQNFVVLQRLWPSMRSSHQRFALVHGILPLLAEDQTENIAGILVALPNIAEQILVLAKSSVSSSLAVQRAVVVVANKKSKLEELCGYCIDHWCDQTSYNTMPLELQRGWAQLCVLCAVNLAPQAAQRLASTEKFLGGVSSHLESSSDTVRQYGTIVAQVFNRVAGHSLDFGIEYDSGWAVAVDKAASLEDALNKVQPQEQHQMPELIQSTKKTPETETVKDSDDEDSDDDEEEVVDAPFYIKDLLAYLSDTESAPKVFSALVHGTALVKRKMALGFEGEVAQYASRLLKTAANLTDQFNLDDFASRRQQLMAATLAAVPAEAPGLVRLLASGDWSMSQRVTIMATLALAAHELAGDESSEEEGILKLPPAQHKAFASDLDRISESLQKKLVISASSDGKVIRKSAALGKTKRTAPNRYAKIAPTFFFPLAAVSPRILAPGNSPGYAVVVRAQWIKTLGYLMWSAYPSSIQISDMARELVSLVLAEFRYQSAAGDRLETVTLEALYTALLYVTEITPGDERREELATWVASTWETATDERVKQLGAAVLVKLTS